VTENGAVSLAEFPWCIYMLENRDQTRIYTGITNDLQGRLAKHNAGKGAKATRAGRPWKLVWRFFVRTKGEALKWEARLKKLPRAEKLAMVREQRSLLR
jgi:putative endonuclease